MAALANLMLQTSSAFLSYLKASMMPDNDKKSFADFSGDLKQFAPRKSSKFGLSF